MSEAEGEKKPEHERSASKVAELQAALQSQGVSLGQTRPAPPKSPPSPPPPAAPEAPKEAKKDSKPPRSFGLKRSPKRPKKPKASPAAAEKPKEGGQSNLHHAALTKPALRQMRRRPSQRKSITQDDEPLPKIEAIDASDDKGCAIM